MKKPTETFEEYTLAFAKDSCTVSANDPEGIRRGLYAFLDEFCAHGGAFPEETRTVTKKPFLSIRLGRCPFSPIKR